MSLELVTRTAKYLLERRMNVGKKQFYQWAFPKEVNSLASSFNIDEYTDKPTAMRTIKQGEPAVVRIFQPGQGQIYSPKENSEKMPIDKRLRDSVLAGQESTEVINQAAILLNQMLFGNSGFYPANIIQRNKAAMDYFRTGTFVTKNIGNESITIDFLRDGTLAKTYDFTALGATIDIALTEMLTALEAIGAPLENLAIVMGKKWLNAFKKDSAVLSRLTAYRGAFINLIPPEMAGVDGLKIVGEYTPDGSVNSLVILGYQPRYHYRINSEAAAPYLPDDEAVIIDLGGDRQRMNFGIDYYNDKTDKIERTAADLVVYAYTKKDPASTLIQATSRYCYMGDVNSTCKSVGTF